jgi:hypothetical protein
MASVQIDTTTSFAPWHHGHALVKAGSRLWALANIDEDLLLFYSDDDGATWSSPITVTATNAINGSMVYDATNSRLNIAYAGVNSSALPLAFRAITANVASGTPGSLTTETVIDAGGANAGIVYPYLIHSDTGTNPRYWVVAQKWTSASTIESRAWFATAGTAADTGANWSTTNFTNLGSNSDAFGRHMGAAVWWTVGGADKVTMVVNTTAGAFESVTFDPTAGTPTPGSVTAAGSGFGTMDWTSNIMAMTLNAKADYLVLGALDVDVSQWQFRKTVDGTTWTDPTGWINLAMGRCQLTRSGSDFYLALSYRKLTTATNTIGAATVFSDTNGNIVTVPPDTGTSRLYALYRGSTASPYTVRSDSVLISGQELLPDADVTTTGWTTAPLFSKVNDASDATFITATAA